MNNKRRVWLAAARRTPIGSFGKSLCFVTPDKLASHTMAAVIKQAAIPAEALDEVILGQAFQSPYRPNIARLAALQAGIPASVPAQTIQMQCGSGMEVARLAMNAIRGAGEHLILAGGVESMSQVDYVVPGANRWKGFMARRLPKIVRLGPMPIVAGTAENGLAPTPLIFDSRTFYMAGTAQRLADEFGISRRETDEFALDSQEKARRAIESGRFAMEIEPIDSGRGFFATDEHPRQTSLNKLLALKSVLRTDIVTAGNSSGINDGAAALLIASDEATEVYGLERQVELVDCVKVGLQPEVMGLGPVYAIQALLERNNLKLDQIPLVEINEAFAPQYLACERMLGLDRGRVNPNGGAIALGHPIAMSGARLIQTTALEMRIREFDLAIAALCVGGGMGIAMLLRNPGAS